jgi:hypothetical protein
MKHPASAITTILSVSVFLICLTFNSSPLKAQDTKSVITGTVYDSYQEPLVGAHIQIKDRNIGAQSDSTGKFELSLDPGHYELIISFIGFKTVTIPVELSSSQTETIEVHMELEVGTFDDQVTVHAKRVEERVGELAALRNERRKQLKNYTVRVQKLGILYEADKDYEGSDDLLSELTGSGSETDMYNFQKLNIDSSNEALKAIGFSERVVTQFFASPRTFVEKTEARRSSKNFFSENEIFSTGGEPLDLNHDDIKINILAEVKTIVGPISERAGDFYYLMDEEAGDDWPEGTIKISVEPHFDRRPLFEGVIYLDNEQEVIIGMDLRLNKAGNVFTGLYSASAFHYSQSYKKVGDFWLPDRTEISSRIGIFGFSEDFIYKETWTYGDYEINSDDVSKSDINLSGRAVSDDVDNRDEKFWEETAKRYTLQNDVEQLRQAQSFTDDRSLLNAFMSVTRNYLKTGDALNQSYFSNFSDFYRFNRVDGHYLGIGLRTPYVNRRNHSYKATGGYATGSGEWQYNLEALQFLFGSRIGIEAALFKQTALQFLDYEYEVGPLNMDELRHTLTFGLAGYDPRNYFERDGFRAGLRYRIRDDFFFRVNFMREDQNFLPISTPRSFFTSHEIGRGIDPNLSSDIGTVPSVFQNGEAEDAFNAGRFSGFEFQFRYDNRQFRMPGLFREYKVRQFGWFTDHLASWSDPEFGADEGFNYFKYRSAIGVRIPLFDSHFLFSEVYVAGTNNSLPAQMQFAANGQYIEDFLRHRPFLTLGFNEAVANRSSSARIEYNLGSDFTRPVPFRFIRQSGMILSVWAAGNVRHEDSDLAPLTPFNSGNQEHIEVGFAIFRILGILKVEGAFRVHGKQGSPVGISIIL